VCAKDVLEEETFASTALRIRTGSVNVTEGMSPIVRLCVSSVGRRFFIAMMTTMMISVYVSMLLFPWFISVVSAKGYSVKDAYLSGSVRIVESIFVKPASPLVGSRRIISFVAMIVHKRKRMNNCSKLKVDIFDCS